MSGGPDFTELYSQHRPAALRVALALVPVGDAEDIVSEAFTRVYAIAAAGGGPAGAFRPYLLAAVRNLARDYHDARRRRASALAGPWPDVVPGAGELAARAEEHRMLARAFARLPARWRAVLWQTEVEEHSPAELASASGMSANAVSQLAVRARAGLALAWERERGQQERVTGPLPALAVLAGRKDQRRHLTRVKRSR